jgi:TolA-binding protein
MKKRLTIFFLILSVMVAMPIIIFPLNASIEDAQFNLALELYDKGQYADSITEFSRLLTDMKTKKYVDDCHFHIGNSHLEMDEFERAGEYFHHIVDSGVESAYFSRSLYLLGRCEYLGGDFEEAIGIFDEYRERFPSLDYADNSLYWKAESLLNTGKREEARDQFAAVLRHYPEGNKADAARFKLKLMDIEDELAAKEAAPPHEEQIIDTGATPEEIALWQNKEGQYLEEIEQLRDQIDLLVSEIDDLKELGESVDAESEEQIEEKMKALIAWENVLKVKEETLKQKELQLDQEYERIQKINAEFGQIDEE